MNDNPHSALNDATKIPDWFYKMFKNNGEDRERRAIYNLIECDMATLFFR